jgi:hypothetical protein
MDAGTGRSERFAEESAEQARKTRERIQARNNKIVQSTYELYNQLRGAFGERTPKMILNKLSSEYGLSAEDLRTIIKTNLKNDPNLARKF